ncbi:hypothetical protein ACHAXS_008627 [Conticribra weissflogii]
MTTRKRHPAMSATATLTNCYVPLPVDDPLSSSSSSSSDSSPFDPRHRPTHDGALSDDGQTFRGPKTLRRLHLRRSVLSQSTGSSLVEWGHTKVLCSVRGPRPVHCSGLAHSGGDDFDGDGDDGKAVLLCQVRYLAQVGLRPESLARDSVGGDVSNSNSNSNAAASGGRIPKDALSTSQDAAPYASSSSAAWADETHLSRRLREALSPSVILDGLGRKRCVEVYVHVLQSDGGVLGAAVAAATLALVDAGVGVRDLVCVGSAAVVVVAGDAMGDDGNAERKEVVLADPNEEELLRAEGVVTIAMMPNWREVTVWDQCGRMSIEASREAVEVARDGCVTVAKFLRNSLLDEII